MTILQHAPTPVNPGPIDVRTQGHGIQAESPTLAEILGSSRFSDRAKRLAQYLDGCCRAEGKWAAWPKVSTMAHALGWGGDPRAFRKRVERGFRELIEAGVLRRMRLGDLAEWFDFEGASRGIAWPRELPRNLRRSAVICILGWRIPGISLGQPILPRCDTGVALRPIPGAPGRDPSVASPGTQVSHPLATQVSHPSLNVRSLNPEGNQRSNVAALAGGGGDPPTEADQGSTGEITPPPPAQTIEAGPLPLEAVLLPAAPVTAPPDLDRVRRAEKIVRMCRSSNWQISPDGSLDVMPAARGLVEPPSDAHRAVLRDFLPEVLAIQFPGRPPADPPGSAPAVPSPGPALPAAPKAREPRRVHDLIGRLAGHPDPSAEATVSRAIADALGDHKPESLGLYLGLAGDVRRGNLAQGCLQEAFEAACGRKVVNRGKVFTATVKVWKRRGRSKDAAPARRQP